MIPAQQILSLDGAWSFVGVPADQSQREHPSLTYVPTEHWLQGQVPGTVQADLLRLGAIPNPFWEMNAQDLGWIEQQDWWYRRTFHLPDGFGGERIELQCAGLDTFAAIWINGALIGKHANQFVPATFEIAAYLRPGENEVVVLLRSTALELADKDVSRLWRSQSELQAAWARKCLCSFGWDLAPRIVTFGVWRSIQIVAHRHATIRDVHVVAEVQRPNLALVQVRCEIEQFNDHALAVEIDLTDANGTLLESQRIVLPGRRGSATCAATITLPEPKLWWPHGMGEQPLYHCVTRLMVEDTLLVERHIRFGVRSVAIQQHPVPSGTSFTVVINDVPVYCKGANWVPSEALTLRATPDRYRALLELARDAHFTMMRVWGGGIYEDPAFYELCDELGLMVWQDFMYACAGYPDDDPWFRTEAEREARIIVQLLRNHPSIVLWCGNNENEWLYSMQMKQGSQQPSEWLQTLAGWDIFHDILPQVCAELDPTRPYWPSSPWGGENPNSTAEGDSHSYRVALGVDDIGTMNYTWEAMDYANYLEDTGKFISEFAAFPAIPEPESLARFLGTEAHNTTAPAWRFHVPCILAFPAHFQDMLDFYTTSMFGVLRDNAIGIDAWMGYARLVQGEALSFGIEHFRRVKWTCSGTLFWQYNSIWPSCDWGTVDYYAVPKPGYYYTKRAYAPVLVTLHAVGDTYEVWMVNDRPLPVSATLQLQHCNFQGERAWHETIQSTIPANTAVCASTINRRDLRVADVRREYLAAVLCEGDVVCSRAYHFLVEPRSARLPQAQLMVELGRQDEQIAQIIVTTNTFARTVRLDLYGARFDDNYFHLQPGERRTIRVDVNHVHQRTLRVSALNAPEAVQIELSCGEVWEATPPFHVE